MCGADRRAERPGEQHLDRLQAQRPRRAGTVITAWTSVGSSAGAPPTCASSMLRRDLALVQV
jgi:hypothetical protein